MGTLETSCLLRRAPEEGEGDLVQTKKERNSLVRWHVIQGWNSTRGMAKNRMGDDGAMQKHRMEAYSDTLKMKRNDAHPVKWSCVHAQAPCMQSIFCKAQLKRTTERKHFLTNKQDTFY